MYQLLCSIAYMSPQVPKFRPTPSMSQFAQSTILAIIFLPSLSTLLNLWILFCLQKERQRINETLFDISLHLKNLSTRYNKKFNDLTSTVQALEAEAHETGRTFVDGMENIIVCMKPRSRYRRGKALGRLWMEGRLNLKYQRVHLCPHGTADLNLTKIARTSWRI